MLRLHCDVTAHKSCPHLTYTHRAQARLRRGLGIPSLAQLPKPKTLAWPVAVGGVAGRKPQRSNNNQLLCSAHALVWQGH